MGIKNQIKKKNMKKWFTIISAIIIVLVVDLITKHFLFGVEYKNLIPQVISIQSNGGNTGAAWGAFQGKTIGLAIFSVVLIVGIFVLDFVFKQNAVLYNLSLGFILGGALGNLFDRLYFKYVRDFIFLDFWPSFPNFNLADSFLCVGAVLLAIYIIFFAKFKNEKSKDRKK